MENVGRKAYARKKARTRQVPNNIANFSGRRGLSFPHRVYATILKHRTQELLICKTSLKKCFMLAGRVQRLDRGHNRQYMLRTADCATPNSMLGTARC